MPVQGFPDPYSGFSQGLSSGIQNGATIMQMIQQKAQAKLEATTKDMTLKFDLAGKDWVPIENRVEAANEALDLLYLNKKEPHRKMTAEDFTSGKAKAFKSINKTLNDPAISLSDKHKYAVSTMAEAGITEAEGKPILSGLEQGVRQEQWNGPQGLADTPAQNYGPLSMGAIPGYSGTPGVGAAFEGLRESDPMRLEGIKQKYLSGKGLDPGDLPKDEKALRKTTIKLNLGPNGEYTPGKMHEWGYDPFTGERGKYIGPATPAGVEAGGYGTVVVMTPSGPMVVKKNTGEATGITGPGGEQIKSAPTAEQSTMKGFFDSIGDSLVNVEKAILDEKGNVKPGIFGPVQGRKNEYESKIPGVAENPAYEAMRTAVANLQDIVYPKSGKAINESELQNLYKYIPEQNDKDERVKAKMANFKRAYESLRGRMIGAAEEGGRGWAQPSTGKPKASDFWK